MLEPGGGQAHGLIEGLIGEFVEESIAFVCAVAAHSGQGTGDLGVDVGAGEGGALGGDGGDCS